MNAYLQTAWYDIRRRPWLTVLVIIVMGIGMATSISVYSLRRALIRNPVPEKVHEVFAPRLETTGLLKVPGLRLPYRDAKALWEAQRAQRQAVMFGRFYHVAGKEGAPMAVEVQGLATHRDFFAMFGLDFRAGDAWTAHEDREARRVAVITAELAERLFPGEEEVVGRMIQLDGQDYRVVGVTRPWNRSGFYALEMGLRFRPPDQVFLPFDTALAQWQDGFPSMGHDCMRRGGGHLPRSREQWLTGECAWLYLWVQFDSPVQQEQYGQFLAQYAAAQFGSGRMGWLPATQIYSLDDWWKMGSKRSLDVRLALLVAFGFLAACWVNATALLLARVRVRNEELQLRRALGASRGALFGQCLTECALIGAAGGVLGLALVLGAVSWLRSVNLYLAMRMQLDQHMVLLMLGLVLGGSLCVGLLPAWGACRIPPGRQQSARAAQLFGAALLAIQLALTLGIASNAMFIAWQRVGIILQPAGIDEHNVFSLISRWPAGPEEVYASVEADLARLRDLPDVRDATLVSRIPYSEATFIMPVGNGAAGSIFSDADAYITDDHALDAMGLRLVAGEWIRPQDVRYTWGWSPPPHVVITRGLADRVYPGQDAVGRPLYSPNSAFSIIGVVEQVSARGDLAIFLPYRWLQDGSARYLIRTWPGRLEAAMRSAEAVLRQAEPGRLLVDMQPLERTHHRSLRFIRATVTITVVVCVLLMLVIAAGVVGLNYYWILQRRTQIGIRRALGARRWNILVGILAQNLVVVAAGVGAGSVLAYALNRYLAVTYMLGRLDAPVLVSCAMVQILLCGISVLGPALRAARMPPFIAARNA